MHGTFLGKMEECKASTLCMQGAINPTKERDIIWPYNTQKPLKWSQKQQSMHAILVSQKHEQMRHKGRRVALPHVRHQNHFFTTENPLDFSGEKANAQRYSKLNKESTKRAKQGLRGGGRPPTPKWPQWNALNTKKRELLYVIHKAQNNMQKGLKASARMGNIK